METAELKRESNNQLSDEKRNIFPYNMYFPQRNRFVNEGYDIYHYGYILSNCFRVLYYSNQTQ